MKFPPPLSFPEGQRALALVLASMAGVFCGLSLIGVVLIVWLGGWSVDTQAQRITVLGGSIVGLASGMIAVILGLLLGGPVGRLKAGISKTGADIEMSEDGAS
jgi:hypothetical protein